MKINFKREFTATKAKQCWGEILAASAKSPVLITRNSRPEVVVVDYDDYLELIKECKKKVDGK